MINPTAPPPPNTHQAGFTLLEVLIALAIFAVTAAALLQQGGQSIRQNIYLEDKTYALWVAENRLTELRLQGSWPALGERTRQVSANDRNWQVTEKVSVSAEALLRQVDVTVSHAGSSQVLARLTGYFGAH